MTFATQSSKILSNVRHLTNFSKNRSCRNISTELTGPWNYVQGKKCEPKHPGNIFKVTQPSTGKELCSVPHTKEQDIHEAVQSAKTAFPSWSKLSLRERGQILTKAALLIKENLEDIARLEVYDTGKPIWEARIDIQSCADAFEYYGGIIPSFKGDHIPLTGGSFAMVTRNPLGVVGGIGAWNFPMQTATWKVAPALAAGNTFVYKPSQFTPVTAVTLGEILTEAGVPDGVYNVIQGAAETGEKLSRHPDIAKVSFTGSVPVGMKIMAGIAPDLKKLTLELGGKSPMIVFEDAHMENSIKGAMMANFLTQGEVCSNGTRVFVHSSIYEEFRDKLVAATKKLKIGNPFEEDTTVGATIHTDHAQKVLSYIDGAVRDGCKVLCGGKREMMPGELSGGWYLQPTVLDGCQDNMKVVKEEVFGSVLSLLRFDTEEEVIRRANDTKFGLAGAVFTKDVQRGLRVCAAIEAGTVWLNTYNLYPTEIPFGGYNHSGLGRENGTAALEHYTQTKTTYIEMGDVDCGPLYPS